MRRGSITVFLSLTLVLLLSLVFSLLEGARVKCLDARAQLVTELATQSLFSNYHSGIWEDYHLLFLDVGLGEEEFSTEYLVSFAMTAADDNLSVEEDSLAQGAWDLIKITAASVLMEEYQLATDDAGQVFLSQVAAQMKLEAVSDALTSLLQLQSQSETTKEQEEQGAADWESALEAIEEAEEMKTRQEEASEEDEEEGETEDLSVLGEVEETDVENPMEYVAQLRASSVLTLVLSDPGNLSGSSLADSNVLLKRDLEEGNWEEEAATGTTDRLLLQYYIQNYFSNYVVTAEKGAQEKVLSYEMEYLIAGKTTDSENLELVVYELLAMREAANFITILQDGEKTALALSIATAAVGFTGVVLLVKAVQIGILLAWAFIESVLDIRSLLDGGKVPLIKTTEQWTSDLTNTRAVVESTTQTEDSSSGLTYTQYLQMLLFLQSDKTLCYRCMDLIERNEGVSMDHLLQQAKISFTYSGSPLFANLSLIQPGNLGEFSFTKELSFSY